MAAADFVKLGDAFTDVLLAASDVAASRAKDEVSKRLKTVVSSGSLQKSAILLATLFVLVFGVYGVLFELSLMLFTAIGWQSYQNILGHLLVGVIGLVGFLLCLKKVG